MRSTARNLTGLFVLLGLNEVNCWLNSLGTVRFKVFSTSVPANGENKRKLKLGPRFRWFFLFTCQCQKFKLSSVICTILSLNSLNSWKPELRSLIFCKCCKFVLIYIFFFWHRRKTFLDLADNTKIAVLASSSSAFMVG